MNPWQEWKAQNVERQRQGQIGPSALLNPDSPKASEAKADARLAICKECPHYLATNQCRLCGCFMPSKVKLEFVTCPDQRWA